MDLHSANQQTSWAVIGWFTPDYRPLAQSFAANLSQNSVPFHLFAREKQGHGWSTLAKPAVVLKAMERHPGKTLILMDVGLQRERRYLPTEAAGISEQDEPRR
jgi:hypothetical protein